MTMHRARLAIMSILLIAFSALAEAQTLQKVSVANDSTSYRTDAARHIYETYAGNIYKGMLPPLVHAVVVVETELDRFGNVLDIRVVRSPSHAPEVTTAVKEMIHRASPFPAPSRLGIVKFTEVWLVDHSGRFQLHALTEGQR
jgi:protein TonB